MQVTKIMPSEQGKETAGYTFTQEQLQIEFNYMQAERITKKLLETGTGRRRTYSGKYALSHHIYCAHCGDFFRRTIWIHKGKNVPVWRCVSRLEKKNSGIDCPARTLLRRTFTRRW